MIQKLSNNCTLDISRATASSASIRELRLGTPTPKKMTRWLKICETISSQRNRGGGGAGRYQKTSQHRQSGDFGEKIWWICEFHRIAHHSTDCFDSSFALVSFFDCCAPGPTSFGSSSGWIRRPSPWAKAQKNVFFFLLWIRKLGCIIFIFFYVSEAMSFLKFETFDLAKASRWFDEIARCAMLGIRRCRANTQTVIDTWEKFISGGGSLVCNCSNTGYGSNSDLMISHADGRSLGGWIVY